MRPRPVAAAILVLLLAVPSLGSLLAADATATAPEAAAPSAPGYVVYPAPYALGRFGGEPSVGVNGNTGAVFVMAGTRALRATFDDAVSPAAVAWRDVTPYTSVVNVDPLLFTDFETGRTFAGGLDGFCSILSMTDDDGASWVPVRNACVPTLDHPSIASGPWRAPTPAQASWDRATYYCAQASGVTCAVSYDGGITFSYTAAVFCGTTPIGPSVTPGLHGTIEVGPNGVVWLPFRRCGNDAGVLRWNRDTPVGVAVSMSNGQAWSSRPIPGSKSFDDTFDPDVAATPSGWAYVAWSQINGPFVSLTKNNGTTWTTPLNIGAAAGIQNVAFVETLAGDDDRVAVAFIGSTTPGNGFEESFAGAWHLYVATSLDQGQTWTVTQVTEDPVQRGWICPDGTGCPDGGTLGRNLLDFIDARLDADGRVVVAFADGCIQACAGPAGTPANSTEALATLARQACGPSLFAAKGNVEGDGPCPVTRLVGETAHLRGELFLGGLMPVGNAETLLSTTRGMLVMHRPTSPVPKVSDVVPGVGGTAVPSVYDASFHGQLPGRILEGPVTARLWMTAEGGPGAVMTVALYDADFFHDAPVRSPLVNVTMPVPTLLVPQALDVQLPAPEAPVTLANGLTLVVSIRGAGDAQIYYDSAFTASSLVFD